MEAANMTEHGLSSTGDPNLQDESETAASITLRVTNQYILPIICCFGILGIILTVIVLSRKNMCTSTNCHLMALAIADLLFLLLLSTRQIENHLTHWTSGYYQFSIYLDYAVIFMHVFLMASIWLTVMLAVERYIAICQPFLAAKVCSVKRARIFVVSIYVFAFLVRLPAFWEHEVVTRFDTLSNTSISYTKSTELASNVHYLRINPWVVDGILMSILPFILLLVLNVRLIWEVRKSTRYLQATMVASVSAPGRSAGTIKKEELQITVMLISIIIVFFICQAPYVVYTAIFSINKDILSSGSSTGFLIFHQLAIVVLAFKSAVNFIIYCWFSEKFWATLKKIFCRYQICRRFQENNAPNNSYYNLRRYSNNCTRDTSI
ncbi:hypothetical protein CAPTEDRAFT_215199 [Capitella teleta]|uniref:G-protein coupled receptors family 1 profile domain-containing protein n=1 Tax=Capitella teleta TaxID=283909 RepID=R7TMC4_CAPTE|nr:hypothetical protein CAPTEDRAFT_215199 [Capitella teleta]|eukprot:ELT94998.1 hypothetical protein CAPTEDRAFT_215199 [Capitella teleta]